MTYWTETQEISVIVQQIYSTLQHRYLNHDAGFIVLNVAENC